MLYVAAHPDDENSQLITSMARGRHYRAAYLAFTRGDGGQNAIGPEFGEELGVIRTQELLAARRVDGGRQFFTRAIDFGYSKSPDETLRIWDRRQVLSDVVRVIRTFRPDVMITGSSPEPSPGQHGHHTASAILALEAFKVAGDAKSFPDQLDYLTPWQPKRIFLGRGGRGGSGESAGVLRIDVGGNDPVTGESFSSISGRSRTRHRTQFGDISGRGGGGTGPVYQSFVLAGGPAATTDLMDGVDTTWSRIPGGAEIGKIAGQAIKEFDQKNPAASVPLLLSLRSKAAALPADPIVDEKRQLLDKIILDCLGLTVESAAPQAEVVPGEAFTLHNTVTVRSSVVPVEWKGFRAAAWRNRFSSVNRCGRISRQAAMPRSSSLPTLH